jgi:hypothetical protein
VPLRATLLTSIRYLIEDRGGTVTTAELQHTDEEYQYERNDESSILNRR